MKLANSFMSKILITHTVTIQYVKHYTTNVTTERKKNTDIILILKMFHVNLK